MKLNGALKFFLIFIAGLATAQFSFAQDRSQPKITFSGIAKFENHCSASLVRFHQSLTTDKALLLTSAHCIRIFPDAVPEEQKAAAKIVDQGSVGAFITNYEITPSWVYPVELKNYKTGASYIVKAKHVKYITRTLIDLALIELDETFEFLSQQGIESLVLADKPAQKNEPISVVSGLYDRQFNCLVEANVPIVLADKTYFRNAIRYSKNCPVFRGTSGSPVISLKSGEVVGINALKSPGPKATDCIKDGLCEVDNDGNAILIKEDSGYATQAHQIYSCLNKKRQIDLDLPGCKLFGSTEVPN